MIDWLLPSAETSSYDVPINTNTDILTQTVFFEENQARNVLALPPALEALERRMISEALVLTQGNKSKAAKPQRTALRVMGEMLPTKTRPAIALPAHKAVAVIR